MQCGGMGYSPKVAEVAPLQPTTLQTATEPPEVALLRSQGYIVGPIGGQPALPGSGSLPNGAWSKSGPYDVTVVKTSVYPDAAGYGFVDQALRISDAVTSAHVSCTPRPVDVPAWSVMPSRSRAFTLVVTPCQYCVRAGA